MVDDDLIDGFMELFRSWDGAHGEYVVTGQKESGKLEGKASTVKGPITRELWRDHLLGTGKGIGGIPLLDDGMLLFSVLDVDIIGVNIPELAEKVHKLGLPFLCCQSKSGGVHLYFFLDKATSASLVRTKMKQLASELGFGGCEVFPKQTSRANPQDMGNWINLPYFGETRKCYVHPVGWLTPRQFIDMAKGKRGTLQELVDEYLPEEDALIVKRFAEGPPCLQGMLRAMGKFGEGIRNKTMFNVAVMLKKEYPGDEWEQKLYEANPHLCDPPLTHSEIKQTINSVKGKEYEYTCHEEPLSSYCNRGLCKQRRFGIGAGKGGRKGQITGLTQYVGGPTAVYAVEVDDQHRVMVTVDELYTRKLLDKKIMAAVQVLPAAISEAQWRNILQDLIAGVEVVQLPEDLSPEGEVLELLIRFVMGQARAKDKEEMAESDTVYIDVPTREAMFPVRAFKNYLKRESYKGDEKMLGVYLKNLGVVHEKKKIAKRNITVYRFSIPEDVDFTRAQDKDVL